MYRFKRVTITNKIRHDMAKTFMQMMIAHKTMMMAHKTVSKLMSIEP